MTLGMEWGLRQAVQRCGHAQLCGGGRRWQAGRTCSTAGCCHMCSSPAHITHVSHRRNRARARWCRGRPEFRCSQCCAAHALISSTSRLLLAYQPTWVCNGVQHWLAQLAHWCGLHCCLPLRQRRLLLWWHVVRHGSWEARVLWGEAIGGVGPGGVVVEWVEGLVGALVG